MYPFSGRVLTAAFAWGALFSLPFQSISAQPGVLVGLGDNSQGQLNTPNPTVVREPRLLADHIQAIDANIGISYFLRNDGTLLSLGGRPWTNSNGPLPEFEILTAVASDVVAFSSAYNNLLYLDKTGTLFGLGSNTIGQLGYDAPAHNPTPVVVATEVTRFSNTDVTTLWVDQNATLWGVGSNFSNAFGTVDGEQPTSPVAIATGVSRAFAAGHTNFFFDQDGALWGIGNNYYAQLGLGHRDATTGPTKVADDVTEVFGPWAQTFILKSDQTLWGVGQNGNLLLGLDAPNPVVDPILIADKITSVAWGSGFNLLLDTSGTAWGYGTNSGGQLGLPTSENPSTPTPIMTGVAAIAAGSDHSLFLTTEGQVYGLGVASYGKLGPNLDPIQTSPQRSTSRVVSIATAERTTYFLREDQTLWAAGSNLSYLRALDQRTSFSDAANLVATGVVKVSTSGVHTVFIKNDGSLWYLGSRDGGRYGLVPAPLVVEPVQIASDVIDAAAGPSGTTFYIDHDHVLWGTGTNTTYQLGLGNLNNTFRFTTIPTPTPVAAVYPGSGHTLYLATDGGLWGMGQGLSGQLGTGTGSEAPTPVFITHGVTSAACGDSNSYYLTAAGDLMGLGNNSFGQLGASASTFTNATPQLIAHQVSTFAAGPYHVTWIDSAGDLWGQGRANQGVLGAPLTDSTNGPRRLAQQVTRVATSGTQTLYAALPDTFLTNLSTRVKIADTGDGRLTAGFVISGTEPLTALIRAVGPQLSKFGVGDTLPNPSLKIYNSAQELVATNDDWSSDNATEIAAVAAELGAFALDPDSLDAAALVTLAPGAYTAVVDRGDTAGGVVLLEVYNRNPHSWRSRLVNLSVRTDAGSGDDTLTTGFVIAGERDASLLVRAVGPTLGDFGVPGFLADPELVVVQGSTTIASNDDWADDATIAAQATDVGGFALSAGSADAAALLDITPGPYTAQVRTKDSATGNALVEVYLIDN